MPQPRSAGIPALVRRLSRGSVAEQAQAASALDQVWASGGGSRDAIAAAIAEAGGIPALVQMMGSRGEHPGAAFAADLLAELALCSPERCQAIMTAAGIAPLVRCLESSSQAEVQAAAAGALVNIAASDGAGEAGKAAIAAASGIPAAVQLLSSIDDRVLQDTAMLLGNLGASSPERKRAIADGGGISPLVRLLRHRSSAIVVDAAVALANLAVGDGGQPCIAAMEAAGGIPALVQLLASSGHADTVQAAMGTVHSMLQFDPASTAAAVVEAGGIPALLRCLRGRQFGTVANQWAAWGLGFVACSGTQPSRAIADAGGVGALVQALACSSDMKDAASFAVAMLLLKGQAAAVAAADPSNASTAALEWLPSSPTFNDTPHIRAQIAEARRLLAAARVCAAPGCGATSGLKRCAGCGSVRYCSEACMRAHWKEHRPECKRLRAAAAAAAGDEAGPSGRA